MLGISGTQQLPQKVQRPRNGVVGGRPSDMSLDHNMGYVRWAEPDLALKGTGN